MKLTKFKKVLLATAITTLTLSAVAYAAPVVYSNLKVHYNVNLVVNGAQYVGASDATKPFITDGGRTYISIASLVESKIANASFDAATSTVTVTGNVANQDQITALSNQVLSLENQNAILKAENETLKKNSTTSKPSTSTGDLELKSITKSSDRTALERDMEKELRNLRAKITGMSTINFDNADVKISHSNNKVTVSIDNTDKFTTAGIAEWNKIVDGRDSDDVEEDFETFINEEIMDVIRDILSDYSDFDIEVDINGVKDNTNKDELELVTCKYSYSKDQLRTSVYTVK